MELSDFWIERVEDVQESVDRVGKGKVEMITSSPGRRNIYLVSFYERGDFASRATYLISGATALRQS